MNDNKSKRTDIDIASEFDRLFDEIPEPKTEEEIRAFLEEADYDVEKLKTAGAVFVRDLIASNWRFANIQDMRDAAEEINAVPSRKGWNRDQITTAINKITTALSATGTQPVLAFRNLDKLSDSDLITILQELEYTASRNGIITDLD
jgi:hypothetical protein